MSDAVVEIEGLRKQFVSGVFRKKRTDALRGVGFRVQPGEVFGLLGPNGAGKTTIIKILLGIVHKSDGQARLFGYQAGDRRGRMRVGFLPEGHRFPRHHSGLSALGYYGRLSGLTTAQIRERSPGLLQTVGLSHAAGAMVKTYSKGMLQRLGLAQAMLHDPELLILDEPTDGVDPVGRTEIRGILNQLRDRGKTVFLNSHLLSEVELICDNVAILYQGELKKHGKVEEITRLSDLQIQFLLRGEEERIRAVFGANLAWWEKTSDGIQATANVTVQEDADRMVDALRAAGVSIVSLNPRKLTLEEAFLQIIGDVKGSQ